jgi:hypothetical protein
VELGRRGDIGLTMKNVAQSIAKNPG